ncbi:MAG: penicillin-binding protein 2 [Endomicrobiaceae bacterium]|nr:penicillin-binding protein 2 [Endomicrobiaceae bacterium]
MSWSDDNKVTYNFFLEKHKNIFIFFVFLFAVLSLNLFYLQIISGSYYKDISERQRLNTSKERAPRGMIYDTKGNILVGNEFGYVALFYPFQQQELPAKDSIEQLSTILKRDINPEIEAGLKYKRVIEIANNLTLDEVFKIQEKKLFLPGIAVTKIPKRKYFNSIENCHVTGYVGEVTQDEVENIQEETYRSGDFIGRGGIEQSYDRYIRGVDGGLQLEVNAKGQQKKAFKYYPPEIGNNVFLTVDAELQKVAYDALKKSTTGRGAAVAIDVKTGAVRVFVSCPGYDTNEVATHKYVQYLKDKDLPLFNRAIQALYAPGSIFKIITFIAAMDYLDFDPSHTEFCTGKFELGDRFYSCWNKEGHKQVNLITATANSCNIYFYKLGLQLGVRILGKYAKMFHLGETTGIDVPYEKKGFVPTPEWKKLKMKMSWLQGDTVILAIGQGALWVTPLQMASMISAVANNGVFYTPYLVENIKNPYTNEIVYEHKPVITDKLEIDMIIWKTLNKALVQAVKTGTARRTYFKELTVAAKTGTAQNPQGVDHAWMVAYAPAENPELAVAVIVENGGGGGTNSVPIAREIFKKYFNIYEETDNTENKDLEPDTKQKTIKRNL